MIGRIEELKPVLPINFVLDSENLSIDFVIDTGFTDFLTLPPAAAQSMKLPFVNRRAGKLADGSVAEFDVFAATILWNEKERLIPVLAMGSRPLLGTVLLSGCFVTLHFVPDGEVQVKPT